MPIVNVKLLEGRSDEQLKNLVTEVTNAVEKTTSYTSCNRRNENFSLWRCRN